RLRFLDLPPPLPLSLALPGLGAALLVAPRDPVVEALDLPSPVDRDDGQPVGVIERAFRPELPGGDGPPPDHDRELELRPGNRARVVGRLGRPAREDLLPHPAERLAASLADGSDSKGLGLGVV